VDEIVDEASDKGITARKPRGRHLVVGNAGLYFVSFELTRLGWNAIPTSRNARGVDVLIYSQDAKRKWGVQVKSLSKPSDVPMGSDLANLLADFYVVAVGVMGKAAPVCYVLTAEEVRANVTCNTKSSERSYWLSRRFYKEHVAMWEKIGSGFDAPGAPAR
jgi:hypothetical protein